MVAKTLLFTLITVVGYVLTPSASVQAATVAGMIFGGPHEMWWIILDDGSVLRGQAEPCQVPQIGCAPTDTSWVEVGNVLVETGQSGATVAGAFPGSVVLSNGEQFNSFPHDDGIDWVPSGNVFMACDRPVGTVAWAGMNAATATNGDVMMFASGGWHYLGNIGIGAVESLGSTWGSLKIRYR